MNDLFGGNDRIAELEARVAALEAMLNLQAKPERVKPEEPLNEAWQVWNRHRNGKGWTAKARELSMKKLVALAGTDGKLAMAIVCQSIERGWTGLFELKEQQSGRSVSSPAPVKYKTAAEALAKTETAEENHRAWLENQRQRGYPV